MLSEESVVWAVSCNSLHRTFWILFHLPWSQHLSIYFFICLFVFIFTLESKIFCSQVLFPESSKAFPFLSSLFLAAVFVTASLHHGLFSLNLPSEGYVDKPSFPGEKKVGFSPGHFHVNMIIALYCKETCHARDYKSCPWITKDRALLRAPRYWQSCLISSLKWNLSMRLWHDMWVPDLGQPALECCNPWHRHVGNSLFIRPLLLNMSPKGPDPPCTTGHKAQPKAANWVHSYGGCKNFQILVKWDSAPFSPSFQDFTLSVYTNCDLSCEFLHVCLHLATCLFRPT